MKTVEFWMPIIISFVLTPLTLFLSVASAGAGHGDYFLAKILFPYTMISTLFFQSITIPFVILAVIQFPLYGFLLAMSGKGKRMILRMIGLAVLHVLAIMTCFMIVNSNF
jgi:hypothetical protein